MKIFYWIPCFFFIFCGAVLTDDTSGDWTPAPYSVSIHLHGEKSDPLKQLLLDVSTTAASQKNPPPTLSLLEAIAQNDAEKMVKVLRAESFYTGTVRPDFKRNKNELHIIFSVTTGKPFLLGTAHINIAGEALPAAVAVPDGTAIGLKAGERGTSTTIVSAGDRLLKFFQKNGYPFVQIRDRQVVVDYATETVAATFTIDPGERASFAWTTFTGLKDVDPEFVRKKIPWQEGQLYDPALVQELRNRLSRTGLFTTVLVSHGQEEEKTEEADHRTGENTDVPLVPLPVTVTVRERDRHTVGLMAGYSTDIGFGGGASWEDRNLLGQGELLHLEFFVSQQMYLGEGRFRLPEFLSPDQSLTLAVQPVYDDPKAYTSYRIRNSAVIQHDFSDAFSVSGGAAFTLDAVEQLDQEKDYLLFSIPISANWSLGGIQPFPRAGALFSVMGEPYYDLHSDRLFIKTLLNTNLLYRFPGADFLTAVGRISFGSIPEASPGEVPADLRFYAGGANSIRGYAYQMVGPLVKRDPVGGRSLFTFSFECDVQMIGDFGGAVFLDGGSAFEDALPGPWDEVRYGTGMGLRYFTPIGPIGLDIGFPLNGRKGIDKDFQVYVSIAQIY
ncbi:MAG: autotransporter assembly complex family protein [PVC group bacterium]